MRNGVFSIRTYQNFYLSSFLKATIKEERTNRISSITNIDLTLQGRKPELLCLLMKQIQAIGPFGFTSKLHSSDCTASLTLGLSGDMIFKGNRKDTAVLGVCERNPCPGPLPKRLESLSKREFPLITLETQPLFSLCLEPSECQKC